MPDEIHEGTENAESSEDISEVYQNVAFDLLPEFVDKQLSNRGLKGFEGLHIDGGDSMGTEERVAKLETHFEYIRKDMDEIKSGQKEMLTKLSDLPTRNDLWAWKLQWTGIAVAAIAIIVGGIIGGLSWIKSDTTPIVITPQEKASAE